MYSMQWQSTKCNAQHDPEQSRNVTKSWGFLFFFWKWVGSRWLKSLTSLHPLLSIPQHFRYRTLNESAFRKNKQMAVINAMARDTTTENNIRSLYQQTLLSIIVLYATEHKYLGFCLAQRDEQLAGKCRWKAKLCNHPALGNIAAYPLAPVVHSHKRRTLPHPCLFWKNGGFKRNTLVCSAADKSQNNPTIPANIVRQPWGLDDNLWVAQPTPLLELAVGH